MVDKHYLSILKLILLCESKDGLRNSGSNINIWTLELACLPFAQEVALFGNCKGQSTQIRHL